MSKVINLLPNGQGKKVFYALTDGCSVEFGKNQDWLTITSGTSANNKTYIELSATNNLASGGTRIATATPIVNNTRCNSNDKIIEVIQGSCGCSAYAVEKNYKIGSGDTGTIHVPISAISACCSANTFVNRLSIEPSYEEDEWVYTTGDVYGPDHLSPNSPYADFEVQDINIGESRSKTFTLTINGNSCGTFNFIQEGTGCTCDAITLSTDELDWEAEQSSSSASTEVRVNYDTCIDSNSISVSCSDTNKFNVSSGRNPSDTSLTIYAYPKNYNDSFENQVEGTITITASADTTQCSKEISLIQYNRKCSNYCGDIIESFAESAMTIPASGTGEYTYSREYTVGSGMSACCNATLEFVNDASHGFEEDEIDYFLDDEHYVNIKVLSANTSSSNKSGYVYLYPNSVECPSTYSFFQVIQGCIKCYSIDAPMVVSSLSGEVTINANTITCGGQSKCYFGYDKDVCAGDVVFGTENYKYIITLNNDTNVTHVCNDNTSVTRNEILTDIGGIGNLTAVTDLLFGLCTENVGDNAFSGCSSLANIKLTRNVTSIGSNAFSYCSSLKSIDLAAESKNYGPSCFSYCSGLTSITISSNCTELPYAMFSHCGGYSSINIPDNVKIINNSVFEESAAVHHNLTAVTIGAGCTFIGAQAFYQCNNLESVTIYATKPPTLSKVPQYGGKTELAFQGTKIDGSSATGFIYVPSGSVNSYKTAENWSTYADRIKAIGT